MFCGCEGREITIATPNWGVLVGFLCVPFFLPSTCGPYFPNRHLCAPPMLSLMVVWSREDDMLFVWTVHGVCCTLLEVVLSPSLLSNHPHPYKTHTKPIGWQILDKWDQTYKYENTSQQNKTRNSSTILSLQTNWKLKSQLFVSLYHNVSLFFTLPKPPSFTPPSLPLPTPNRNKKHSLRLWPLSLCLWLGWNHSKKTVFECFENVWGRACRIFSGGLLSSV